MFKRPTYDSLWSQYYDYINYPDSSVVKQEIGGDVNSAIVTNTCAVRLSYGLNYSGIPVPNQRGLYTLTGSDRKRYALRVRELGPWLETAIGKPDLDIRKSAGKSFDKSQWSAKKGIIRFDISFSDATGHLDMWDSSIFSSEYNTTRDYWQSATRIALWVLA